MWKNLEVGWIKVNYDRAFSAKKEEGVKGDVGIGVILRDEEAKWYLR